MLLDISEENYANLRVLLSRSALAFDSWRAAEEIDKYLSRSWTEAEYRDREDRLSRIRRLDSVRNPKIIPLDRRAVGS